MLINQLIHYGLDASEKFSRRELAPAEAQRQVLGKLLKKSAKTIYGQAYDFAGLLEAKDLLTAFQERVPLADYNDLYNPWWERVYEGHSNVTWPGRPKYFAMSSGTSDAATKYIPVSKAMLKALGRGAFRMFATFPDYGLSNDIYTSSWLSIGGTTHLHEDKGRKFGYLSGINAREQPIWARSFYKPGREIARIPNFDDRLEAIARRAPEWKISVLVGIPHWIQLTLERIIELHNLERISDIWPDLELFVSGGVDYKPYEKSFTRLIGHPIKYLNTYLASEGMFAFQRQPDSRGMEMILDNGIFYEFLPFNADNFDDDGNMRAGVNPVSISQVETGVDYAMIISTCAGAWRYLLGDTISFLDTKRAVIQVTGRTKHYVNLVTEHLTVDNMNAGIVALENATGVSIPEFTIVPVKDDQYIAHEWYLGTKGKLTAEMATDILDHALGEVNDDYKSERQTALQIRVQIVPLDKFYEWQNLGGQNNGQSKIPRVMKGAGKERWLKLVGAPPRPDVTNLVASELAVPPWEENA